MKTKDLTRIALIAAISVILSLFTVFRMPNGGSITIYLVPLYIALANESVKNCFFIGLVVAILQIILGGTLINPLSPILDYILPVVAIVAAGIFKQNIYVNITIGAFMAMVCYVLSGMLFWSTPFLPSLVYNATFFVPTVILNVFLYVMIAKSIKRIYV